MPKKKKKKKGGAKAAAPSAFAMLAGSNPEEAEQFLNVARTMLVGNDGTTEGSKWSEKRRHHTSTRSSLSPNPVSLCLSVSVCLSFSLSDFVCLPDRSFPCRRRCHDAPLRDCSRTRNHARAHLCNRAIA